MHGKSVSHLPFSDLNILVLPEYLLSVILAVAKNHWHARNCSYMLYGL
jgi:hypothetical protein